MTLPQRSGEGPTLLDETEREDHEKTDGRPSGNSPEDWPTLSDIDLEICLLAAEPRRRSPPPALRAADERGTDRHVDGR